MSSYLITYDLNSPGQKHQQVIEVIKSFYGWAKLSESSYALNTHHSVEQIHSIISEHLDSNDHFYVIHLSQPYSGFGPKEVNDWLDANLDN